MAQNLDITCVQIIHDHGIALDIISYEQEIGLITYKENVCGDLICERFTPFGMIPDMRFVGKGYADHLQLIAAELLLQHFPKHEVSHINPKERRVDHLTRLTIEVGMYYPTPEYYDIIQHNAHTKGTQIRRL
ncbi:MAG: hypothetical protein ACMXYK_04875 [Candidatus Woesearchaeota archaeon]